jgi:hypothetical protein
VPLNFMCSPLAGSDDDFEVFLSSSALMREQMAAQCVALARYLLAMWTRVRSHLDALDAHAVAAEVAAENAARAAALAVTVAAEHAAIEQQQQRAVLLAAAAAPVSPRYGESGSAAGERSDAHARGAGAWLLPGSTTGAAHSSNGPPQSQLLPLPSSPRGSMLLPPGAIGRRRSSVVATSADLAVPSAANYFHQPASPLSAHSGSSTDSGSQPASPLPLPPLSPSAALGAVPMQLQGLRHRGSILPSDLAPSSSTTSLSPSPMPGHSPSVRRGSSVLTGSSTDDGVFRSQPPSGGDQGLRGDAGSVSAVPPPPPLQTGTDTGPDGSRLVREPEQQASASSSTSGGLVSIRVTSEGGQGTGTGARRSALLASPHFSAISHAPPSSPSSVSPALANASRSSLHAKKTQFGPLQPSNALAGNANASALTATVFTALSSPLHSAESASVSPSASASASDRRPAVSRRPSVTVSASGQYALARAPSALESNSRSQPNSRASTLSHLSLASPSAAALPTLAESDGQSNNATAASATSTRRASVAIGLNARVPRPPSPKAQTLPQPPSQQPPPPPLGRRASIVARPAFVATGAAATASDAAQQLTAAAQSAALNAKEAARAAAQFRRHAKLRCGHRAVL